MGFLLKEVLKNLCAANQWCYAVFWKIGCQNPNLLIWEECHYEPMSLSIPRSGLPFGEWEGCWASPKVQSSQVGALPGDRVQTLINKMMMDNQVNVVGEGIVGRSAFTGNHQWILSNNYIRHAHSPEVSSEVQNQFSAGMQTVVVVPVLPHGVVQLGSPLAIPENMGFVNDVKSLILQLGCVPGALLFDHYPTKVSTGEIGLPETFGMPVFVNSAGIYEAVNSTSMPGTSNQQSNLPQASTHVGQSLYPLMQEVQDNALTSSSTFQTPKLVNTSSKPQASHCQSVDISAMKRPNLPFRGQLHNSVVGADVIPSNLDAWLNQQPSSDNLGFISNHQPTNGQLGTSHSSLRVIEQNFSEVGLQGQAIADFIASQLRTNGCEIRKGVPNPQKSTNMNLCSGHVAGFEFRNVESSSKEVVVLPDAKHMPVVPNERIHGLNRDCEKHDSSSRSAILKYEDTAASVKASSGDDLFDMLGLDYKNKILNVNSNGLIANELNTTPQSTFKDTSIFMNMHDPGSEIYPTNDEISDSGLFSGMGMGTDHLLDAVVSRAQSFVKQSLDDNVSCGTTVTKISSSSIPNTPPTYGRGNRSDQAFGLPNSLLKPGGVGSSSFKSGYGKDDPGSCSQTSSIYGSQISSWAEQGHNVKHDTSVSTGFSKKPDDTSKPNRKRLKPGENPRPRPKDRQMIQDRVKELREIVPNGAKCSIDALLERTIKHMLFLQSVTKHADKLKHTGESKIVNKEGGLVLKDNFEGGATWAFEVGSQSMVCPIIVEDLSSPRQMLVEMLCEERGFFLEIADLIRGMGLTILKGVMEARNDQIWARFAVEANRDVTRMEIFMSLVRLLEQTIKGSASSGNSMDNNNMIIHHSFPQVASIPATGSMQ